MNWADPNSADYRADLVGLIEKVTEYTVYMSRYQWHTDMEVDDMRNELYLLLFTNPKWIEGGRLPTKLLYIRSAEICFKQRKQAGAVLLGREALTEMLRDWDNLPSYVHDVIYGPVFRKAAGGRYLDAVEQAYYYRAFDHLATRSPDPDTLLKSLGKVMTAAQKKTLLRAMDRLTEVLADVMCGQPVSFDIAKHDQADQTELLGASEDDGTFCGHSGTYGCTEGHELAVRLAVKPPHRLGTRPVLGYRNCRCGQVLSLAA